MHKDNKYYRAEYVARINRVIDYIDKNLSQNFTLEEVATVANFSPFHFHRIFRFMVGEPLNQFISRIRMERAASFLIATPEKTITEIMFDVGINDSSSFSRLFKKYMKMSPTDWRNMVNSKNSQMKSNFEQQLSNVRQTLEESSCYITSDIMNQQWSVKMKTENQLTAHVTVKEIPEFSVAYVRYIGPYAGNSDLFKGLFEKIFKWAGSRGLINFPETKCMCIYHDDPNITDEEKLRTSICLSVPDDTEVGGEIGKMKIPAGKYAFANFRIDDTQFQEAWNIVCKEWLPESGYVPDDRPTFEMYNNDVNTDPEHKFDVDIVIPVKPMV